MIDAAGLPNPIYSDPDFGVSGGKGLNVVTRIRRLHGLPDVERVCRAVVVHLANTLLSHQGSDRWASVAVQVSQLRQSACVDQLQPPARHAKQVAPLQLAQRLVGVSE